MAPALILGLDDRPLAYARLVVAHAWANDGLRPFLEAHRDNLVGDGLLDPDTPT
jgi:hypothetical protein